MSRRIIYDYRFAKPGVTFEIWVRFERHGTVFEGADEGAVTGVASKVNCQLRRVLRAVGTNLAPGQNQSHTYNILKSWTWYLSLSQNEVFWRLRKMFSLAVTHPNMWKGIQLTKTIWHGNLKQVMHPKTKCQQAVFCTTELVSCSSCFIFSQVYYQNQINLKQHHWKRPASSITVYQDLQYFLLKGPVVGVHPVVFLQRAGVSRGVVAQVTP